MTETKRGRKPHQAAEIVDVQLDKTALVAAGQAATELAGLQANQALLADIYRKLGRVEALGFMATVSERAIAEVYLDLKDNFSKIKDLDFQVGVDGSRQRFPTFDDFCRSQLGLSDRRCRQIVGAIDLLGAELYERSRTLGLGERQFREIRALPDAGKDLVKKAIEANDKDSVIQIIEELAARNAAQGERLAETDKVIAAKDKVIRAKDEKLNAQAELEHIRQHGTVNEREVQQILDLEDAGTAAETALMRLVTTVDRITREEATAAAGLQARQTLDFVCQRLADLCAQAGLSADVLGETVEPGWLRQRQAEVDQAMQDHTSAKAERASQRRR